MHLLLTGFTIARMTPSNSDSTLSTEEVCRTYFETQVFGPGAVGDQSQLGIFAKSRIDLEFKGISFDAIDEQVYTNEIIAANIELFGMAWIDHQIDKDPEYRDLPTDEIGFTKNYLSQMGKTDIWDRMAFYNNSLMAVTADSIVSEHWGQFRDWTDPTESIDYK